MAIRKRTNEQNNLQSITHKTKDQVTRTPLKTGDEFKCSGRMAVPAPLLALVVKTINKDQ
jgi:hypothetical protein